MNHSEMQDHHSPASHDHHAMMIRDFRKRFYTVLALTPPILFLSPMILHWMHIPFTFPGSDYLLLLLSTFVFLYGGRPFLSGWWDEMKDRNPGMMTLIGFAITVAYVYSAATVAGLKGMDFFWELDTLILIMLLGHWIEMKSVAGASRELELLVRLMPSDAHFIQDNGQVKEVRASTLAAGDRILVKPGEKIAADGVIAEGESFLNESMLTGESRPVHKTKGDKVIAAAINGNGVLKVSVTHSPADSYLSRVVQLVKDAQKARSRTQLLADTAARWLTIIALLAGMVTFTWWFIDGKGLAFAIERMVTVIVICCPHALGLAVPLVVAKSTALSAQNGLLIRNRTAFENARRITTLVFDKTGTLTIGKFEVVRYQSTLAAFTPEDIMRLAAALEKGSEHPIATGILKKVKDLDIAPGNAADVQALSGEGITGVVDGKKVAVVSPQSVTGLSAGKDHLQKINAGETLVYVVVNDQVAGFIALADQVRPESRDAIRTLHQNQIKTTLLTGDNKVVAEGVAKDLGMDNFFAEVLPHQKLEKIKELQGQGEFVAMTGDGVNDAPALAQADVGIAVGSGSDIAAETAGIVLVNSNPKDIVSLILFGKATYRKMIQNLLWATGYNVIALPLAAGVLYKQGILLSPAAGAVLMSLSTIVVAINAGLLKVKK
ncbi:copper-translocating P-type ATPase [Flavitalea sp. BT771]|uniref:copper-translocating P-type ATPase n=1 Tax=Flavitalea sp. BT771 TaxID=3063329 RepID=UPI0026E2B745|nr:copper-translocating P-type ATPase [Flavitalea sp. BT771]MDO6430562.1 copper-translocating P-type ATPase [Flavitalea sp. BT771]MDV6219298.1 copper-translocating P-type ATPase [Flavitalea sp. BT771]